MKTNVFHIHPANNAYEAAAISLIEGVKKQIRVLVEKQGNNAQEIAELLDSDFGNYILTAIVRIRLLQESTTDTNIKKISDELEKLSKEEAAIVNLILNQHEAKEEL